MNEASDHERASQRVSDTLLVSYTILPDVPPEFTETYDIAIGGLAMLTNAALRINQEIIIELELRADVRPNLRLAGTVRWSTYNPLLEKYRTGVAFTAPSEEYEHDLLRYIDTIHRLRDLGIL